MVIEAKEFKPCCERLEHLVDSPESLLSTEVNAIGRDVKDMEPDLFLLEETSREVFGETVSAMATKFVITLNRQLCVYH